MVYGLDGMGVVEICHSHLSAEVDGGDRLQNIEESHEVTMCPQQMLRNSIEGDSN